MSIIKEVKIMSLTDLELEALLDDIESDCAERKETFDGSAPKKVREAICAFANDLPSLNKLGVVFIGVCDDGTPKSKFVVTDELLRTLADIHSDGRILPLPAMTVEKRCLKGADVAVITVLPSDMPPVKFDGRIWIRVGSRRAIASAQEERILNEKRRYNHIPFDIRPISIAKISELSRLIFENEYLPAAFASDVLEANGRTYEERLASCKMIVSPEDTTPTFFGLLTVGTSPQDFLQGAYIQFLRIQGLNLEDDVSDSAMFTGTLREMLSAAIEKLKAHNRIAVDVTSGPTHHESNLYPPAALHQILYNAVLHRNYEDTNAPVRIYWFDDRIEIHSPGGPYGSVTIENFGQQGITDYRNPNILTALRHLGFVQAFGRGIALARRAMLDNGNPELEFTCSQNAVVCILRGKQ